MTDRTTRYEHDSIEWFEFPDHVREAWRGWLRLHGVDPNDIPLPGWIERDEPGYRLCYLSVVRKDGRPQLNAAGDGALTETRCVQLQGPPLPFPDARYV